MNCSVSSLNTNLKSLNYRIEFKQRILLETMFFTAITANESGYFSSGFTPSSQLLATTGSKGILPKYGNFNSSDIFDAPPVSLGNISDWNCKQIIQEKFIL